MKSILFVTIDPIANRRRVLNAIETAQKAGFQVHVISVGPNIQMKATYPVEYISVPFQSGLLKFFWFNFILFWRSVFEKYDLIYIRGLWVLPAILLRQVFHTSSLIYDAHEYFAGLATFEGRPWVKKFWLRFEKMGIPRFEVITTVSESIADKYKQLYPGIKEIKVLRNLPAFRQPQKVQNPEYQLDLPAPLILFHGYFLEHRGLEHLIHAMTAVEKVQLLLVGEGPLEIDLKRLVSELKLEQHVFFRSFVPQELLIDFAAQADIGVTLLEPISENHKFALPNKFFEYIMSGLPVLVSDTPTLKMYIERYHIGLTVDSQSPEEIAKAISEMTEDVQRLKKWESNCHKASQELCWEKERNKLIEIYSGI